MALVILDADKETIQSRKIELIRMNGKYYIELNEFEQSDSLLELSISLASEGDILRERIQVLEEQLKYYKDQLEKQTK